MSLELDHYLRHLEDLRRQVGEIVADLPSEALNWRPIDGSQGEATNSLAVLVAHVAGAEHFLIAEVAGGRPPTRDREAEFAFQSGDAAELASILAEAATETREVLSALSPTDLEAERHMRSRTVSVRWSILHATEHAALHLGHMQLTCQLWKEGAGKASA